MCAKIAKAPANGKKEGVAKMAQGVRKLEKKEGTKEKEKKDEEADKNTPSTSTSQTKEQGKIPPIPLGKPMSPKETSESSTSTNQPKPKEQVKVAAKNPLPKETKVPEAKPTPKPTTEKPVSTPKETVPVESDVPAKKARLTDASVDPQPVATIAEAQKDQVANQTANTSAEAPEVQMKRAPEVAATPNVDLPPSLSIPLPPTWTPLPPISMERATLVAASRKKAVAEMKATHELLRIFPDEVLLDDLWIHEVARFLSRMIDPSSTKLPESLKSLATISSMNHLLPFWHVMPIPLMVATSAAQQQATALHCAVGCMCGRAPDAPTAPCSSSISTEPTPVELPISNIANTPMLPYVTPCGAHPNTHSEISAALNTLKVDHSLSTNAPSSASSAPPPAQLSLPTVIPPKSQPSGGDSSDDLQVVFDSKGPRKNVNAVLSQIPPPGSRATQGGGASLDSTRGASAPSSPTDIDVLTPPTLAAPRVAESAPAPDRKIYLIQNCTVTGTGAQSASQIFLNLRNIGFRDVVPEDIEPVPIQPGRNGLKGQLQYNLRFMLRSADKEDQLSRWIEREEYKDTLTILLLKNDETFVMPNISNAECAVLDFYRGFAKALETAPIKTMAILTAHTIRLINAAGADSGQMSLEDVCHTHPEKSREAFSMLRRSTMAELMGLTNIFQRDFRFKPSNQ